jgi:hypothetical protein
MSRWLYTESLAIIHGQRGSFGTWVYEPTGLLGTASGQAATFGQWSANAATTMAALIRIA